MANEQVLNLFVAQASNANGSWFEWAGGEGIFTAWGNFGGGTCKLQTSPDSGATGFDVDRSGETYVTFTAAGSGLFRLPRCHLRAVLSGATAPSLNADARGSRAG